MLLVGEKKKKKKKKKTTPPKNTSSIQTTRDDESRDHHHQQQQQQQQQLHDEDDDDDEKDFGMMNELCVPVLTVTAALAHAFLINAETTRATNAILAMLYAIASRVIFLKMLAAFWCTVDALVREGAHLPVAAEERVREREGFNHRSVARIRGGDRVLREHVWGEGNIGEAGRAVKNLEDVGKKCVKTGRKE